MRAIQTNNTFNQGLETVDLQVFFTTFPEGEYVKVTLEANESASKQEVTYGVLHFAMTATKPETTIFYINPTDDNSKPASQLGNAGTVRFETGETGLLMLNNSVPYSLPADDIRFSPTDLLAAEALPETLRNFLTDITNIAKAWKSNGQIDFWPWELIEFDSDDVQPTEGEEPNAGVPADMTPADVSQDDAEMPEAESESKE